MRVLFGVALILVVAGVMWWRTAEPAGDGGRSTIADAEANADRDVRDAEGSDVVARPANRSPEETRGRAESTASASGSRIAERQEAPVPIAGAPTSPAKFDVTFACDTDAPTASWELVITGVSPQDSDPSTSAWPPDRATPLAPGQYAAVLRTTRGILGPIRTFEVIDTPLEVVLEAPRTFAIQYRIANAMTGEAVSEANVTLTRLDVAPALAAVDPIDGQADEHGDVVLRGVVSGRWRVFATAGGFIGEHADYDIDAPEGGPRAAPEDRGEFYIAPRTAVRFRLVGARPSDDLSTYSISHTHEGEHVPFDANGDAELVFGRHDLPLYVIVYCPDETRRIIYMDGGLPEPGQAHEIAIGTDQSLAVDLRLSPSARAALDSSSMWINVCFRSRNEDANKASIRFVEDGVYEFTGVDADEALIGFAPVSNSRSEYWACELVTLAKEGETTARLDVDRPPIELRVVDDAGPVQGLICEMRIIPDTTTWLVSGSTNDEGMVTLPRLRSHELSLFAFHVDRSLLAVDVAINVNRDEPSFERSIAGKAASFVEVRSPSAKPVPGVDVDLVGAKTQFTFHSETTDDDGRALSWNLIDGSRALLRPRSDEHWFASDTVPFLQARNEIVAYPLAFLEARASFDWSTVTSSEFGSTIAEWLAVGRVSREALDGGKVRMRVPMGQYEIVRGVERRAVEAGAGAVVGVDG